MPHQPNADFCQAGAVREFRMVVFWETISAMGADETGRVRRDEG